MAVPSLNAEEFQYSDTGLVLNNSGTGIPFFDVTGITGLDNAPARTVTQDHDGMDGGYVDSGFETIRTVILDGTLYASATAMETYLDSLKANYAPSAVNKPLYFGTDAGVRMVNGKAQGLKYNKDQLRRLGAATAQIQVMCEDPRIYTPASVSGTVSLVSGAIAGRGYNKSYSFGYGAAVTQGSLALAIGGNRDTPGILRIDGAVVNPTIINDTTGDQFVFNLSLAAGEYVTINLANKAVLKNGTQSVRNSMSITGSWFLMQPGTNFFRLLGTQSPPTPVAQLTATANSAWR